MPAFAVEVKGSEGAIQVAQLQCAYDGALMTEGARAMHQYLGKSDDDFYGKTQALTVAFNGETLKLYCHHAVQISALSQSTANNAVDTIYYHQFLCGSDNPRDSFEGFQNTCKHIRNAEDFGYSLATQRKDALWAYTNADNTQTSPNVLISAQQPPNDSLVPFSSGPPDGYNCDAYDDETDPTDQLLIESWTNSMTNNQDFSMPIVPTDNGYASPAPTCNPITPPQSSKDVSVPFEPQQLSVPTVIESGEDVDFNARGHRKTRARTHYAVAVEGPREVVDKSKSRKTRMLKY